MLLTENKYKEKTPFETITQIRSLLNELDIPVHEMKWYMETRMPGRYEAGMFNNKLQTT